MKRNKEKERKEKKKVVTVTHHMHDRFQALQVQLTLWPCSWTFTV